MDSATMRMLSLGLSSVSSFGIGAFLLWRYRASALHRQMAFLAFSLAGYALLLGGLVSIASPERAVAWAKTFLPFVHLTVLTFFLFVVQQARSWGRFPRLAFITAAAAFGVELLLRYLDLAPMVLVYQEGQGWLPHQDRIYQSLYMPASTGLLIYGLFLLVRRYLKPSGPLEKTQIGFSFLALAAGIALAMSNNIPALAFLGGLTPLAIIGVLSYAMTRHRLLAVSWVLKRGALVAFMGAVFGALFLSLTWGAQFLWQSEEGRLAGGFVAVLFGLSIYPWAREKAGRGLESLLGLKHFDPQSRLLEYARLLTQARRIDDYRNTLVQKLRSELDLEFALVYARTRDGRLLMSARYPLDSSFGSADELKVDSPAWLALEALPEGIDVDELRLMQSHSGLLAMQGKPWLGNSALFDLLEGLKIQALFPVRLTARLEGFLAVGPTRSGGPLSHDEFRFLESVASQLAAAIEMSQLQQQVQHSDRLGILGGLAAGVAHELRNPLTSISLFAQMLRQRHDEPAFMDKFDEVVGGEIKKLQKLTEDMLSFSRPASNSRQPIELSALCERSVQLLRYTYAKRGVRLRVHGAPERLWIEADESEVSQVLVNLLLNALQASRDGDEVECRLKSGAGWVELAVSDKGCGMNREQLRRLFEPFYSTKQGGTGLGLSTCLRVVEAHRGRINVESQEGQGSVFTVRLPLAAQNISPQEAL